MRIKAQPLTFADFQSYGQVIEHSPSSGLVSANQGTAKRRNWQATLKNLRDKADPNLCTFHVTPVTASPFTMRLLERHLFSTQCFIPMNCQPENGYLVIVCLNGDDNKPDFSTLKAFVASNVQAINYNPGCWHHPIIALHQEIDFVCLVWEAKEKEDCEEVFFNQTCKGRFPDDVILVDF